MFSGSVGALNSPSRPLISQVRFAGVGVASCICDKVLGSFSATLDDERKIFCCHHVRRASAATAEVKTITPPYSLDFRQLPLLHKFLCSDQHVIGPFPRPFPHARASRPTLQSSAFRRRRSRWNPSVSAVVPCSCMISSIMLVSKRSQIFCIFHRTMHAITFPGKSSSVSNAFS